MRVPTRFLLVALVALGLAPALVAQEGGRIDTAIASDSRETMAERSSFPPTQPKIYVFAMVADAPPDTPVGRVQELSDGMWQEAGRFGAGIVGVGAISHKISCAVCGR